VIISAPGIHTGLAQAPFCGWCQALGDVPQKHQKTICAWPDSFSNSTVL